MDLIWLLTTPENLDDKNKEKFLEKKKLGSDVLKIDFKTFHGLLNLGWEV
ncbi:MAG: hypothetical protein ACP5C3_07770 [Methanomicrobiales archaeon]